MNNINLLENYDNVKNYSYKDMDETFPNSVYYDELGERETVGVLKANRYVNGRLLQTFSEKENHLLCIAGTRLGKTSSFVIPQIFSFAKAKNKRSMVISDPKGEIYRKTSAMLQKEGYKVLLINFRDYKHSECWNPLTPIYRKFQEMYRIYDEVELVDTPEGPKNKFDGVIYDNEYELEQVIERQRNIILIDVGNMIDTLSMMIIPNIYYEKDPFWTNASRDVLRAILYAMLEDSRPELLKDSGRTRITEDTYSFSTIIALMNTFDSDMLDSDFFSERPDTSTAAQIIRATIPEHAQVTKDCIVSTFSTKMSIFRESAIQTITRCNSFDMNILTGDEPVALFIDFRDEVKVHYTVITLFIQDAYKLLIEHANNQKDKRKIPFYFILDEFGNFPELNNFSTIISACAGRNIFFMIILQSYAQLNAVYGGAVAAVIRDNLNQHIFFGSNNPETLEEFSRECGFITRISPLSALNGDGPEINAYQLETIPLMPKSKLMHFEQGECVITEANSGYVLFSKLERYYLCKEYTDIPENDEKQYIGGVDPFQRRYMYFSPAPKPKKNPFDF